MQEFCPSQCCCFFLKRFFCPALVSGMKGTCLNSLSAVWQVEDGNQRRKPVEKFVARCAQSGKYGIKKTPVHLLKQPPCNPSTMARSKQLPKHTRDGTVHLLKTGTSQSTTGKQLRVEGDPLLQQRFQNGINKRSLTISLHLGLHAGSHLMGYKGS